MKNNRIPSFAIVVNTPAGEELVFDDDFNDTRVISPEDLKALLDAADPHKLPTGRYPWVMPENKSNG